MYDHLLEKNRSKNSIKFEHSKVLWNILKVFYAFFCLFSFQKKIEPKQYQKYYNVCSTWKILKLYKLEWAVTEDLESIVTS